MKTIFITSFHPLISRNIVASPVISRLVSGGRKVVVLVPNYKVPYFQKTYGGKHIVFEGVETGPSTRTKQVGIFKRIAEASPNTERAAIGRKRTLSGSSKSPLYYYLFYVPVGFFGRFLWFGKFARFLDYHLSPKGRFSPLLEKYKPDLVFSADIQNEFDVSLVQDALRKKIRTIGMIRSWDNPSTRTLRVIPDSLIVHNPIIAKEVQKIDGVRADIITVTGIPHYDAYVRGATKPRDEFLRSLGLDPQKKTVLYTPICDYRMSHNTVDEFMLRKLADLPYNTIVRFPPAESVRIGDFAKPSHMVFDRPGYVFDEKVYGNRDVTPEDEERFINELAWVDVVVCGPSTIAIDAAFFDRPALFVDFYPAEIGSEEKMYEYRAEHIKRVVDSGAVEKIEREEDFGPVIESYMRNPQLRREERRKLVESHCGPKDGKSSERVIAALIAR